jgi:hypothetical protein
MDLATVSLQHVPGHWHHEVQLSCLRIDVALSLASSYSVALVIREERITDMRRNDKSFCYSRGVPHHI